MDSSKGQNRNELTPEQKANIRDTTEKDAEEDRSRVPA